MLIEIKEIFESLGADFWLRGGWAIDFQLGEFTHPHEDIDITTWAIHRDEIEQALLQNNYEKAPVKTEFRKRQSNFRKGDVDVQFGPNCNGCQCRYFHEIRANQYLTVSIAVISGNLLFSLEKMVNRRDGNR